MPYIIMAQQETGEECRGNDKTYSSRSVAVKAAEKVREDYPEWRAVWVEEYKDANYYYERLSQEEWDDDDYDLYREG